MAGSSFSLGQPIFFEQCNKCGLMGSTRSFAPLPSTRICMRARSMPPRARRVAASGLAAADVCVYRNGDSESNLL